MRKTLLFIFCMLSFVVFSQEEKCKDYKIGNFTYTHPSYKNWMVKRSTTEQVETDVENKIQLKASVDWISDCEYILTYSSINDSKDYPIIGQKINVKIVSTKSDRIVCISKGLGIELELEMLLVK